MSRIQRHRVSKSFKLNRQIFKMVLKRYKMVIELAKLPSFLPLRYD